MVTIKALGEDQNATGDACGAFCLAAIAYGMGIIPVQQNSPETIEYEPNNIKIKGTLHLDKNANEIAKEIYKITGNLKNPKKGEYNFTDKLDKKNKNSVSGLALVASKLGMNVKVNLLKGCKMKNLPIYKEEQKQISNMNGVALNENLDSYTAPNNNEAQIVCVNEQIPTVPFAHWIAVDSDSELYDPRNDEPKEEDDKNKKLKFDNKNLMILAEGKYDFADLWITLSKK
ncbi:MAG: hypothetical protein QNJ72_40735 [Pleurocapsa sp. MO_226.B13]|nr:hypothetical protein [Pleurocapsa sp. MO_226.B13]